MSIAVLRPPRIPAWRFGRTYHSLTQVPLMRPDGSATLAHVGAVNAGLIRRDLRDMGARFARLQAVPISRMLGLCAQAAEHFLHDPLPVDDAVTHGPEDYVRALSAGGGLPHALVRANMAKIAEVLTHLPEILRGLTRGLDPAVIECGLGAQNGVPVSFYPTSTHLGVVLPSNSPGVNSLWLPAVALRVPVLLKPGRDDPWTPWRIIQALRRAGCPDEACGFYPAGHDGAGVILSDCHRVIFFGDAGTVARYAEDPRVSVHGPGYSKVLIGPDAIEDWPRWIEVLADSVTRNGGRSCVNASTVVVPRHGRELAQALAAALVRIEPVALDAPAARLAGFADPRMPTAIDRTIDQALATGGAEDVTAALRGTPRCVTRDGQTYLRPTVVYCEDPEHTLARTEFLFPFVAVVEVPAERMGEWIGPSLVVTAITEDARLRRDLLAGPHVQRLNLGPIPTGQVRWDQPHEGNLFEFLFARRAVQEVAP